MNDISERMAEALQSTEHTREDVCIFPNIVQEVGVVLNEVDPDFSLPEWVALASIGHPKPLWLCSEGHVWEGTIERERCWIVDNRFRPGQRPRRCEGRIK